MRLRRYTTPSVEIRIQGIDLTQAKVFVTFRQGYLEHTYKDTDIEVWAQSGNTHILVRMPQEHTAELDIREDVDVEVGWMIEDERNATNIKSVRLYDNLHREVE